MKKLVVLSGPSCVGKGPLRAALRRCHADIKYADVVYRTMKAKLERRKEDSAKKIEERASSAFVEMQDACHYTDRIVNHAGDDARDQWGGPARGGGKTCPTP